MNCVAMLVEGPTEEQFVKKVLSSYLLKKEIFVEPIIVKTKITVQQTFKGGTIKLEKILNDIRRLITPKYSLVTTFLDFYGLDKSFLPENYSEDLDPYEKIKLVEENLYKQVNNEKFLPYIQLHEFETFLFVDSEVTVNNLLNCRKSQLKSKIDDILAKFKNNPELVNNSPQTAPSKRIVKMYPGYQKPLVGTFVCQALGIDEIKNKCRHFSEWLEKLEKIMSS